MGIGHTRVTQRKQVLGPPVTFQRRNLARHPPVGQIGQACRALTVQDGAYCRSESADGADRTHMCNTFREAVLIKVTQQRHDLAGGEARSHAATVDVGTVHVTRVDQHHVEAMGLQDLEHRDPVDPGRLHRHRGYLAFLEPVGQGVQVASKGGKVPDRARSGRPPRTPPWRPRPSLRRQDGRYSVALNDAFTAASCHEKSSAID